MAMSFPTIAKRRGLRSAGPENFTAAFVFSRVLAAWWFWSPTVTCLRRMDARPPATKSPDLAATIAKAKAAGATLLTGPYRSDDRNAAMLRFPGGVILEIQAPA